MRTIFAGVLIAVAFLAVEVLIGAAILYDGVSIAQRCVAKCPTALQPI